jgi:hypothetical protein
MKIRVYLKQVAERQPTAFEWGPEFEAALHKMDTTIAKQMWLDIASGEADVVETLAWVQRVAKQIRDTVIKKSASDRDAAPAALKAIGFYGRSDTHRRAKEHMQMLSSFDGLDGNGNPVRQRPLTGKQWISILRRAGFLKGEKDKTATNLVNKWRKELGID